MLNQHLWPSVGFYRAGEPKTCSPMRVCRKKISEEEERQVEARRIEVNFLFDNNTCNVQIIPCVKPGKETTKTELDRRCKSLFAHDLALSAQFCLCAKLTRP